MFDTRYPGYAVSQFPSARPISPEFVRPPLGARPRPSDLGFMGAEAGPQSPESKDAERTAGAVITAFAMALLPVALVTAVVAGGLSLITSERS